MKGTCILYGSFNFKGICVQRNMPVLKFDFFLFFLISFRRTLLIQYRMRKKNEKKKFSILVSISDIL
jgi:hypothetical protein